MYWDLYAAPNLTASAASIIHHPPAVLCTPSVPIQLTESGASQAQSAVSGRYLLRKESQRIAAEASSYPRPRLPIGHPMLTNQRAARPRPSLLLRTRFCQTTSHHFIQHLALILARVVAPFSPSHSARCTPLWCAACAWRPSSLMCPRTVLQSPSR